MLGAHVGKGVGFPPLAHVWLWVSENLPKIRRQKNPRWNRQNFTYFRLLRLFPRILFQSKTEQRKKKQEYPSPAPIPGAFEPEAPTDSLFPFLFFPHRDFPGSFRQRRSKGGFFFSFYSLLHVSHAGKGGGGENISGGSRLRWRENGKSPLLRDIWTK